ncbi:MAG: cation:proton antiporter [Longimicrobiales bacterium]
MAGFAVLLIAAAIAFTVVRWLALPAVPALLIAGLGLAAIGAVPVELLEDALVLGATFLLFVAGNELNPRRTRAQRNTAIRVGTYQFFLLAAIGFAAAAVLGFGRLDAVYIALALTASSTLVVVQLLQRRGQLFEPFARLVVGVLLLQDMLVILIIPFVTRVPEGMIATLTGIGGTVALVGLAVACYRWVAPFLLRTVEPEILLLGALALLFLFLGITDALGLPLVTGAFLAGVALSRFPVNAAVRSQLASISDFFSALFYIALGALIGVPTGIQIVHALVLGALVVAITPPLVAAIAERYGFSGRPAIEAGLLLAQTSEFSLVVGLYGMLAGQIGADVFRVIALVTLGTMMATPFITSDRVVWRLMRLHPVRADVSAAIPESGHVLLLGSGTTGLPLLETLVGAGNLVVVVDDDPVIIERLREADIPCIRGDASDVEVLRQAHADRARIISSTIRRPQDNRRLLEFARGVPILVRVFDEHDAEWIRELGGTPIVYSRAAAEEMMRWFDATFATEIEPDRSPIRPSGRTTTGT